MTERAGENPNVDLRPMCNKIIEARFLLTACELSRRGAGKRLISGTLKWFQPVGRLLREGHRPSARGLCARSDSLPDPRLAHITRQSATQSAVGCGPSLVDRVAYAA
jgi:hypothetical protein